MKKLLFTLTLFLTVIASAQTKNNVDPRLLENHGEKIHDILTYRKDYYKFLYWELSNAYEIVVIDNNNSIIQSTENIVSNTGQAFNKEELNHPEEFNFIKYNFIRNKEHDVYYNLGDGRAIKFTALKVLWKQFDETGLNTKQ